MADASGATPGGETYAGAGVSIDAGEEAVERIKAQGPLHVPARGHRRHRRLRRPVRASTRPATASPVLVSSTDGVGTKALDRPGRRAVRDHRRRPRRHVRRRPRVPGRRAAVLPRLHRGRPPRPRPHRAAGRGRGRGLPPGRLRAHRRRDGRAPRRHGARRVRPRRASRSASSSATARHRRARSRRATCSSACPRPTCAPTATRSPAGCCSTGAACAARRARLRGRPPHASATSCSAPSVIYAPAVTALRQAVDVRAVAHITGGGIPGNLNRVLPKGTDGRGRRRGSWEAPADLHRDPAPRRAWPTTRWRRCSTWASA